jgi:DNA-binding response OmpR family regulator
MCHPNRWVRKEEFVTCLWPYKQNAAGDDDYRRLSVAISRLRKKLESGPDDTAQLMTQSGLGYQIRLIQDPISNYTGFNSKT